MGADGGLQMPGTHPIRVESGVTGGFGQSIHASALSLQGRRGCDAAEGRVSDWG